MKKLIIVWLILVGCQRSTELPEAVKENIKAEGLKTQADSFAIEYYKCSDGQCNR